VRRCLFGWGGTGWVEIENLVVLGGLLPARLRDMHLRLGRGEATVGDEAFEGQDHGHGLDLAGNVASGRFRVEIGQFPEAGQDLVAIKVQLAQPFDFLVDQLFLDGGAVLDHVGVDAGLDLGVSGGLRTPPGTAT
jgi:hypothetical protein